MKIDNFIRDLVFKSIFGPEQRKAQQEIREKAKQAGIVLLSTQNLYESFAKGECGGFTTPAFNLRTLTFDSARALFRAAKKEMAGAFVIELAKSEIDYTKQLPLEYVSCVLAAALQEKWQGPVFIQGDHFSLESKEAKPLADLQLAVKQAVSAGFYNIDIDCSSLVSSQAATSLDQQKENYSKTAKIAADIRKLQPKGLEISVGGEVSAIGGENTTPEDIVGFVIGFQKELIGYGGGKGLIKLGCQMATEHGGRVSSMGLLEPVNIDFDQLKLLSAKAREYGLAGIVQHGASTLSDDLFEKFPETGVCEIHLATQFQNIIFDSKFFPTNLKARMYQWLSESFYLERKDYQADAQFFYKFRKRAFGPFKKEIWGMPQINIDKICEQLEDKFTFFFRNLKVSGTKDLIQHIYNSK